MMRRMTYDESLIEDKVWYCVMVDEYDDHTEPDAFDKQDALWLASDVNADRIEVYEEGQGYLGMIY